MTKPDFPKLVHSAKDVILFIYLYKNQVDVREQSSTEMEMEYMYVIVVVDVDIEKCPWCPFTQTLILIWPVLPGFLIHHLTGSSFYYIIILFLRLTYSRQVDRKFCPAA